MDRFSDQTLLVVAPHPDDEVLGCGGLIKRIKDEGGRVFVMFMTVGDTHDYSPAGLSTTSERMKEIEAVAEFLRYDDYTVVHPGSEYHLMLDTVPQKELMHQMETATNVSLNRVRPTVVATPRLSDYNQDHRAATMALFAAARPAPRDTKPLQNIILGYESVPTAGWWDTNPGSLSYFVEMDEDVFAAKLAALRLYESQLRTGSHPRSLASVEALGKFRGISAGVPAAEAFSHYRTIT